MVKKVMTVFVIGLLILLGAINVETIQVQAAGEWDNFDVRTKESKDVTVDSMKKRFKELGKEDSPFYKNMEYIFQQGDEYGLNVAYIVALMAKESGWGLSPLAKELHGYGGIKKQGGKESTHDRDQSFKDEKDGINAVFELIHRYTTGKIRKDNLTGMEEIREVYCPDSDGCISGYTDSVGSIMEGFGQDPGESGMKKKVSKSESEYKTNESDYVGAKGAELFVKREAGKTGTGLDESKNMLGGDILLLGQNWNNMLVQTGLYAGALLVGFLLLYTSVSLVGYLVLSSNGASPGTVGVFEKATGTSLVRGRETMFKLIKRWAVVLLIIVIYLTGTYVWALEFVLTMLERIIDFLIRW